MTYMRMEPRLEQAPRLYDLPEPRLRLTPRMLGAITAVGLVYAGGGMMLNLAGVDFAIPSLPEPVITVERWTPPPPPPVERETVQTPAEAPIARASERTAFTDAFEPLPMTPTPIGPAIEDVTPIAREPIIPGSITTAPVTPAPPQPPAPPMIKDPTWQSRPSPSQLGRLYPARAAERGVSGAATLECRVTADGAVTACAVVSEAPKGYGFGAAALASTRYFRMSPRTVDGQAIEGAKVRIPMGFNLAG